MGASATGVPSMPSKHRARNGVRPTGSRLGPARFGPARFGLSGMMLAGAVLSGEPSARAQVPAAPAGGTAVPAPPEEHLTVHGQRPRFEAAPVPGAPLGPPPENPTERTPHLGRYEITGKQAKRDGYDAQTGAFIAPFGSAYTQAGPVSDGLASRYNH